MITRKQYLTIAVTLLVGLLPPLLVYKLGRDELHEKYAHSDAEAEAGYAALVKSVGELRETVKTQSDTIIRLQAHIEFIETVMKGGLRMTSSKPLPAVMRPAFAPMPSDLGDAREAQVMSAQDFINGVQAK